LLGALNNIDQTIQKSTNLSATLWPELLDIVGLIPTFNNMSLNFIKQTGVACQFISSIESIELEKNTAIAVYKIAEEALNNIAIHAQASEVSIHLDKEDDRFKLRIVDNGNGFNTRVSNETKWYGFIEMMHRASMINAEVNIYSLKNRGTEVVLMFEA